MIAVAADQSSLEFPVVVRGQRIVDGGVSVYEFWLELDGIRVDDPVQRAVRIGDSLAAHAAGALKMILRRG